MTREPDSMKPFIIFDCECLDELYTNALNYRALHEADIVKLIRRKLIHSDCPKCAGTGLAPVPHLELLADRTIGLQVTYGCTPSRWGVSLESEDD